MPNALGERAFSKCFAETHYGKFSPAHVLKAAEELRASELAITQATGDSWVSKAPKYQGHRDHKHPSREWLNWLEAERPKLYRSLDSEGRVWLVQNPDAWQWDFDLDGELSFHRPPPLPTSEKLKPTRASRRD